MVDADRRRNVRNAGEVCGRHSCPEKAMTAPAINLD
jgi:hypothetical protein